MIHRVYTGGAKPALAPLPVTDLTRRCAASGRAGALARNGMTAPMSQEEARRRKALAGRPAGRRPPVEVLDGVAAILRRTGNEPGTGLYFRELLGIQSRGLEALIEADPRFMHGPHKLKRRTFKLTPAALEQV